jgi:hypothetical protein
VVVLVGLAAPPEVLAVPCGQPGPGSTEPTAAELGLDTDKSDDPALPSFEGKTETRDFLFVFTVSGCTLNPGSDVKVRVAGDGADAVSATPEAKGNLLVITGKVDPEKFDPGTHKPTLLISSPTGLAKAQGLRLTLQRKEPPTWPVVISLVALVAGLFYAFLVARQAAIDAYDKKKAEQANQPQPKKSGLAVLLPTGKGSDPNEPKIQYGGVASWFGVAIGAVATAGAAFGTGYVKSATWSLDFPNPEILFVAVAAAAAGGAAAGLSKAVTAHELPKPPPAKGN